MDWSDCPLVEVKPGVQRGRPVLKGTRMPADDIVDNWEAGLDAPEIASDFRLPLDDVRASRGQISMVVPGSNIWPGIGPRIAAISAALKRVSPGSFGFIEVAPPVRRRRLPRPHLSDSG
jgi:uncharacterized protein (DUF433 family)